MTDRPAFEFGSRVLLAGRRQFIGFESEDQFSPEGLELATAAAEQVQHYRAVFATVESAAVHLVHAPRNLRQDVDAAIALALSGRVPEALVLFEKYMRHHEDEVNRTPAAPHALRQN